jgi:hypothetical protein
MGSMVGTSCSAGHSLLPAPRFGASRSGGPSAAPTTHSSDSALQIHPGTPS